MSYWGELVETAMELEEDGPLELLEEPIRELAGRLRAESHAHLLTELAAKVGAASLGALVRDPETARVLDRGVSRRLQRTFTDELTGLLVQASDVLDAIDELDEPAVAPVARAPKPALPAAPQPIVEEVPVEREALLAWAARYEVSHLLDVPILETHARRFVGDQRAKIADLFLPLKRPAPSGQRPSSDLTLGEARDDVRSWLRRLATYRAAERATRDAFLARARRPAFPSLLEAVSGLEALQKKWPARDVYGAQEDSLGYPLDPVAFRVQPTALLVTVERGRAPLILPLRGARVTGAIDGVSWGFHPNAPKRAIDAALDALCDPEGEAARAYDAHLATPSWVHALREAESRAASRATPDRNGRLAFRVQGSGRDTKIEALLQTPRGRAGEFTAGKKLDPRRARAQAALSPLEGRVVDDLVTLQSERLMQPESAARRLHALMLALADHPRVSFDASGKTGAGAGSAPIAIRRGRLALSLVAARSDQGGGEDGHEVVVSLGGAPRTPDEIERATLADGHVILADDATRTYWLAHIDATTSALVAALAEIPASFPSEGVDALLDVLGRPEVSVDVVLPDELLGVTVEADPRPVVQLAPLGSEALSLSIGVRPIAGGRLCEPGAGAERVMGSAGGARISAHRRFDEERARAERLLAALPLDEAEREGPFSLRVSDPDRAADVIVALDEQGDAVRVEWPEGTQTIVATARRADLRLRVERKHDWFGVEGEAQVGGHRIALSALLAAIRGGHRFVRVGPKQLVAIARELRERLYAADDTLLDGPRGLQAAPPAFASLTDLVESDAQIRASKEFTALRARVLRARTYEPPAPRLEAELRPYQLDGYRWLARLAEWGAGACLADDMGLGKTLQALALLVHRAAEGPALVIAPTSVGPNWMREAERFAPSLSFVAYRGPDRRALLDDLKPGRVLVTSYDLMARDAEALASRRFATLVLDEAQALKNALAKRAAAARELSADFCVALTGTPIENHLGELWSLFRVVSPGLLGGWERFRTKFAGPIERDRDPQRRDALAALLRPYLLRRTKAAVAPELPARIETQRLVTLSPPERDLYEAERLLALETLAAARGPEARFAVLAALTRLRQLACHPRMRDPGATLASSKLASFLELVSELREGGHRALVFSQFTTHLGLVREALVARGVRFLYLDGSTPAEQREGLVRAFQEGDAELFLISLKAGGTGLNLTAADFVIHLDPWWNPAAEDQATDRAHRIGQSKPVTVVRLLAQGTIEEAVVALHADKRELAEGLLSGGELAGKLSTEDLAALMRTAASAADDDDGAGRAPRSGA